MSKLLWYRQNVNSKKTSTHCVSQCGQDPEASYSGDLSLVHRTSYIYNFCELRLQEMTEFSIIFHNFLVSFFPSNRLEGGNETHYIRRQWNESEASPKAMNIKEKLTKDGDEIQPWVRINITRTEYRPPTHCLYQNASVHESFDFETQELIEAHAREKRNENSKN